MPMHEEEHGDGEQDEQRGEHANHDGHIERVLLRRRGHGRFLAWADLVAPETPSGTTRSGPAAPRAAWL